MRLQKYLAGAGLCSRRAAETLIRAARVSVDGEVVTELGLKVDSSSSAVRVDGRPVRLKEHTAYIALNKPRGVVTTVRDTHGRTTVMDILGDVGFRLYPVGRLDQDSQGLLLLTNDGSLAFRLLHPSHKVAKTYRVTVHGRPSSAELDLLRRGIEIQGKTTLPCEIRVIKTTRRSTILEIVLKEGRKRQIRAMFDTTDHGVSRLIRTRIGPLRLGKLPAGKWRMLTDSEVASLRKAVGL
jgi:23S rRNA pseudouridine2605 synthase